MARKILIIEDDEKLSGEISTEVKKSGYEPIVATDGFDGFNKAKTLTPDLILLDVFIPKMDGQKICRLLKFDVRYKSIPIIIISVKPKDSNNTANSIIGADDYVPKPFNMKKLLEVIQQNLK